MTEVLLIKACRSISKTCFSLIIISLLCGCNAYRMNKKSLNNYFVEEVADPVHKEYKVDNRTISYLATGKSDKPDVIFLHGAPGSVKSFIHFLKDTALAARAQLIAVERPGYGYSNYGESITSVKEQAQLLKPLIDKPKKSVILVGHSFGGPIAVRMAMDYPDLIDGLILVAPAIDPDLEPAEDWFRMPFSATALRWLLPPGFRVANDEILHLENELRKMLPLWKNIKIPVTVIQGQKDVRVPPGNAQFAEKMLINSPLVEVIMKEDLNHFIPDEQPELIKEAIHRHLSLIRHRDNISRQ